jgi:hypothetical protein
MAAMRKMACRASKGRPAIGESPGRAGAACIAHLLLTSRSVGTGIALAGA